jgi:hypothetical protein
MTPTLSTKLTLLTALASLQVACGSGVTEGLSPRPDTHAVAFLADPPQPDRVLVNPPEPDSTFTNPPDPDSTLSDPRATDPPEPDKTFTDPPDPDINHANPPEPDADPPNPDADAACSELDAVSLEELLACEAAAGVDGVIETVEIRTDPAGKYVDCAKYAKYAGCAKYAKYAR